MVPGLRRGDALRASFFRLAFLHVMCFGGLILHQWLLKFLTGQRRTIVAVEGIYSVDRAHRCIWVDYFLKGMWRGSSGLGDWAAKIDFPINQEKTWKPKMDRTR